ncbi:MAG: hypothetical protein HKN68_14520 [Saprospiraceae bacterium]|nr:hypothetical protein [Saprospiraceae bacterium]
MPHINDYNQVEDFAADESFQEYCFESSKASKTKWDRYKKQFPDKAPMTDEAKVLILMLGLSNTSPKDENKPIRYLSPVWRKGAISVTIVFILGFLVHNFITSSGEEYQMVSKTAEGNELSMMLSDLSKIDLRKNSTLQFKESWTDSNLREVWLEGEAFFEVEKSRDKIKPFLVHLPKGQVKVFGTKFLVKCDSTSAQILLEEGKIAFEINDKNFDLEPGDVLNYTLQGMSIVHDADIRAYDSWRTSQLSFQNEELGNILEILKHSYGLEVALGNSSLKSRKISANVYQNDPHLLLEAIAVIYNIDMVEDAGQIILK